MYPVNYFAYNLEIQKILHIRRQVVLPDLKMKKSKLASISFYIKKKLKLISGSSKVKALAVLTAVSACSWTITLMLMKSIS